MKRWTFTPPNDRVWHGLRSCDITSTESAALFDMSPYFTKFELYHRKLGRAIVEIPSNERMLWGTRLQDVIARGIADDHGVKVRKLNQYMRVVEARMGSSFDFEIIGLADNWEGNDTELRRMYREHGVGNFEIKCVDFIIFRDQWTVNDDKSIEAPAHIEIQVQHQLHVADRAWAAIGVLVAGHTPKIIIRDRDLEVGQTIELRIRELFAMVREGRAPEPSFPDDAELVCKLNGYAEPGRVYDGRADLELIQLCAQYADGLVREKHAKEDKEVAKAKILQKIGDAERALVPGFNLSASMVGPAEIPAFTRSGYRNMRITAKKAEKVPA